jgi:hypothetical protein
MQWDEDLWSVAGDADDPAAFLINHGCDGNVWLVDAITLVARSPIAASEELRADYALLEADEDYISAWVCACASCRCRRRVTGRDWRSPELQRRYAGHFSPLIAKRIAARFDLMR